MTIRENLTRRELKVVFVGDSPELQELSDWAERHGVRAVKTPDDDVLCAVVAQSLPRDLDPPMKQLRDRHLPCLTVSKAWCFLASAIGRGVRPVT